MSRHLPPIALIVVAVSLLYSGIFTTYFCGYDDFSETHRAAFEDRRDPMRILTTTHYGTSKYRPLNRALTYLTWHLGGNSAKSFRLRNIACHAVAASLVYAIAWLLFGSSAAAVGAALLFGFHPLANQSVVGAVMTNTLAHASLLGALFLFMCSLSASRRWLPPLLGALFLALIAVSAYEADVVVLGLAGGCLFVHWIRGEPPRRPHLYVFLTGTGVLLAVFFGVRFALVSQPSPLVPVRLVARNGMMYVAALLSPIDLVFANTVFGTPLPSELKLTPAALILVPATIVLFLTLLAVLMVRSPGLRSRWKTLEWPRLLFLVVSIGLALAPFLAHAQHPSETYLYLPSAFWAMLLSVLLWHFSGGRKAAYAVLLSLFLLSFGASTVVRNSRVAACGAAAKKILSGLPVEEWRQGHWEIRLASAPEEPPVHRYGFYGYRGLSSIDPREPGARSAEWALQLATRNEQLKAEVVDPLMLRGCTRPGTCFWVYGDGSVTDAAKARE